MSNGKLNIISKIFIGGLFVSIPVLTMAAMPVDIVIGNTTYHCTHNEIKVLGNGSSVIQLNADSCDLGGTPVVDTDGDGYSDTVELAEGTNPNDATDKPLDTDGDLQPNSTDLDDDNDGYTDAEEIAAGTDPLDSTSKPTSAPPPLPTSQGSLVHELDFVTKYNIQPAYTSKAGLLTAQIDNKDYYIVNPGLSSFTSLPSCVNGKSVQHECAPTGWTMGVDDNDVFALRYMTKSSYTTSKIKFYNAEISAGALMSANYKVTVSKVPGDMTVNNSYPGRCTFETVSSSGSLYITKPGTLPYVNYGIYCEIPAGEEFYVNVELLPSSYASCRVGLCGGMITGSGLQNPTY